MDDIVTRKIPVRYAQFLYSLILSGMVSFLVSGIATVLTVGLNMQFVHDWLSSWPFAWLVAFPSLFLLAPLVRRIVDGLVDKRERGESA